MKSARYAAAIWVYLVAIGFAQTPHPCDVSQPTSYQVPANQVVAMGWCQPATDKIDGFAVVWNGSGLDLGVGSTPSAQVAAKVGEPSASGQQEWRSSFFFGAGVHVLTIAAFNVVDGQRQLSSPSQQITIAAGDEPPQPVHVSSISISPASVESGANYQVTWACSSVCSATDYVALFKAGAQLGQPISTNAGAGGSFTEAAPADPGSYEWRYCLSGTLCPSVGAFSVISPPPPPINECETAPIVLTVSAWPTRNQKTRADFFVFSPRSTATVTFAFTGNKPVSATANDGTCSVTVRR